MSFTDPLPYKDVESNSVPLPRISIVGDDSTYANPDGTVVVKASHDLGKRNRRMLRIDFAKMAPDPFRPAEEVKISMSNYIVFDLPPAGFTIPDSLAVYRTFKTLYTDSNDSLIQKLLGGES